MTVEKYIKKLLAVEEYAFSTDELLRETDKCKTAILIELSRLIEKKGGF